MQRLRFILPLLFVCVCPTLHSQHTYPKDTIDGQVYHLYTVERSIGLYRISKNFDVSQESILQANPHLQHQGLSYGETIRIPIGTAIDDRQNIDTLAFTTTKVSSDSTIRLAIMLPLHADAIKRSKTMDRFYDFYTGALIAINEVQKQGQKLEVFIYDVGKTAQKTTQILRDSTWQKVDAIIGPAYAGQVNVASTYAQQDSTWLLVPFLPNVNEIDENPFLLKFNPSAEAEVDTLVNYLALRKDSINCVLFDTKEDEVIPSSISILHAALKKNQIPTTTTSLRNIIVDSLDGAFIEGKENIVIFNTEKFSNLNIVMPHLLKAYSKYNITLYTHYSWQDEKIILPQIYTSIFKEDYHIPEDYILAYETYFGHPLVSHLPRYDLLGYDITLHLLRMLQGLQVDSTTHIPTTENWYGVQSNIHYKSIALHSGYENQQIHVVRR